MWTGRKSALPEQSIIKIEDRYSWLIHRDPNITLGSKIHMESRKKNKKHWFLAHSMLLIIGNRVRILNEDDHDHTNRGEEGWLMGI